MAARHSLRLTPAHALLAGRTGRGVAVAVIDSGVNPANPHVGRIASATAFAADGSPHDDALDRLGHGTAVVAAIQEKAPHAEIHVLRVFHDRLATTLPALLRAIDGAIERGVRLINLSLGTPRPEHAAALAAAVARAAEAGTFVVAAREDRGVACYPGCLDGVLGVVLDWSAPRMAVELRPEAAGSLSLAANGYARPIPGVPPERNLKGISFAVANTTGMLACALEDRPHVASPAGVLAAVAAGSGSR